MKIKHWTQVLCDEYREQGFKYAIFDRRSKGDGINRGINCFSEMYQFLRDAYPRMKIDNNDCRIALIPEPHNNRFTIMYYPDDGTFWVKGRIRIL